MIISNSNRSGSIRSAINYFFSDTDSKKEQRPFKPELLKGDKQTSIEIGKLTEKFSHQTVSGVIAFAKDEKLTRQQMLDLIDRFEETFFGNMKDRVNAIYVLHQEKDSFHIHYAIPRIDLKTGKHWNPFPPGAMTKDLMKAFSEVENHRFGFKQVEEKFTPLKLSETERKIARGLAKHGFSNINLLDKNKFTKLCIELVKDGTVANRQELIEFLKESGVKFSRISESYFSIERDGKNIRLKGDLFSHNNGKNYSELKLELKEKSQSFNVERSQKTLERIVALRNDYNDKRYIKSNTPTADKQAQKPVSNGSRPSTAPKSTSSTTDQAQHQVTTGQPTDTSPKSSTSSGSSTSTTTDSTNSNPSTGSGSMAGIGGAEATVARLSARLANAKTYRERIEIEFQLATAMAQLEAEKTKWLEEQRNQNKGNKI
ncbi:relaxase/mobilization nuclease domain-containing protein [Achromobacter marplatensis]|uniref:relaxase/mobilization nuclease domain-containing protein n=1 Tax=Achromobacter marplatensis TaxID=470868 RepID=UPI003D0610D2